MTNVDKLAREITAQLIPHLTSVQNVDLIKAALKSYGDECAKQMREEAKFLALEVLDEGCAGFMANKICALPLPSEEENPND